MPTGKDLKRLVRARMKKTGESYTAARAQLLNKQTVRVAASATVSVRDYAKLAGMSDASVKKATGCTWERWVKALDKAGASGKSHGEIAKIVKFFKTDSWWTQMVTVGYERIRGLRDRGQQRGGGYRASKSKTFDAPLARVYEAFENDRMRTQWLDGRIVVKSATSRKRMRLALPDGTAAIVGFLAKGPAKSIVAVEHQKLASRAEIEARKKQWGEYFDRLAPIVTVAV
jgi:hypothetical protein